MTITTPPAGIDVTAVVVSAEGHTILDTADAGIRVSASRAVDAVLKEGIRTRIDFRSTTTAVPEVLVTVAEKEGFVLASKGVMTADGDGM